MKTHNDSPVSSSSPKPRQHRNRDANSRFHPSPPSSFTTSMESGESHSSPVRRKSCDNRRQRSLKTLVSRAINYGLLLRKETLRRFENDETSSISFKEIGGSARYTGRFASTTRDSPSFSLSSKKLSSNDSSVVSAEKASSSRKAGVEVPSRFMNDVTTSRRSRRGTSDSNIGNLNGDSSVLKKFALKSAIKRANSLTGYKSSKTQWALSPGRSESPVMSVESMEKPMSFSSLKQPNSPTPNKWRYANAKAQAVNGNISHHAESNLIYAWDGLTKLQHSVLKKKIQFAREKLEMKIAFVLYHQMKLLEAWGGMERQHVSAITATKECFHAVVCRVPLLEGAKVNMQSTSIALRQASDIAASIKSILTSFSPLQVDKTAAILSELAKVVAQEKQLLEEFL
ncbi:QWRF family [Sesbania bispinosa]|nr:QWRF family [Sesbania bispinosa]